MTFFVICAGVGFLFLVVSAVLGGLADFGGHFDFSGHLGGLGAAAHFSPVSPTLISFFLTVFGGVGGLSMSLWEIQFKYALLIALVTALGSATIVYLVLCKIFETTEGGVEVNVADLVGQEADVITGIPKDGVGEIAFITPGGRLNAPARSADASPIPYNTIVQIVRVVGSTYIVKRAVEPPPAAPAEPPKSTPQATPAPGGAPPSETPAQSDAKAAE